MKEINLPPFAPTLMESTRAIGYSIETAIADVIDNSVAAGADRIDIDFFPIGESYISRLEKLSVQSNTLSAINKIIEIENDNLSRLRIALDTFSAACSPEEIAASLYSASKGIDQPGDIQVAMAVQEKRIDDSFFALARELRIDPNIHKCPTDSFSKVMGAFYMAAKDVVGDHRQNRNQKPLYKAEALAHLRLEFLSERERLLARKEKMLNTVIFGHLSLDEIKNMYHAEYAKQDLPQAERTEME